MNYSSQHVFICICDCWHRETVGRGGWLSSLMNGSLKVKSQDEVMAVLMISQHLHSYYVWKLLFCFYIISISESSLCLCHMWRFMTSICQTKKKCRLETPYLLREFNSVVVLQFTAFTGFRSQTCECSAHWFVDMKKSLMPQIWLGSWLPGISWDEKEIAHLLFSPLRAWVSLRHCQDIFQLPPPPPPNRCETNPRKEKPPLTWDNRPLPPLISHFQRFQHSLPSLCSFFFYHPKQTTALFEFAFVLLEGGQTGSVSAAAFKHWVYLRSNYKQQTSKGIFLLIKEHKAFCVFCLFCLSYLKC